MTWTTVTLQVTTPLFNGGADPDGSAGFRPDHEAGIRVASIRGAMRFWFRALAGVLTGQNLDLLASLERRVFGGISDGADNTGSPLLLRIPKQPPVVPVSGSHSFLAPRHLSLRDRRQHESRWLLYLMGQGLGDLAGCKVRRPYVDVGQEFQLKLAFRHTAGEDADARNAIEGLAVASLWLMCTYGGVGARTRRGFGGVRVIAAGGPGSDGALPLPDPWREPASLLTPGLAYYEGLTRIWPDGPVAACMRYIAVLAGTRSFDPAWTGPPSFPVLSRSHTRAATSGKTFGDWSETLIHAGGQLRHFRADRANPGGGVRYDPFIETPEWASVIHGDDDHFPLGALGLPVVYKDNYVVNADGENPSEPPRRRASPLWLRAVGAGNRWRLLSFAFQDEFLPPMPADSPGVHLWSGTARGKPLRVTDDDVKRQTDRWIDVLRDDDSCIGQRYRSRSITE
jgi:hypothetical protein